MKTIIDKNIVAWKLGKELVIAGIQHNGMSLFGTTLEILLVDENQAAQAQTVINVHTGVDPIAQRYNAAESNARNVPSWATWTETQVVDWWNTNLSDAQVDAIANLADAKILMKKQNAGIKAMARMLIAIRDRVFPNVPEG
jgi:hypothetical protein